MATITLAVPDGLKSEMDKTDWINWSSVARHAFSETLKDLEELRLRRKISEISEIDNNDTRRVKDTLVADIVKSAEKTSKKLKSGKAKPLPLAEFNKWCESA
jgi:hypothetical protein